MKNVKIFEDFVNEDYSINEGKNNSIDLGKNNGW